MKRIDDTNIAIGARIKELRLKKNMTQEIFAEKAEICSGQQVSNIERGISGLSISKLIDVCKVLEIEADYLLFGIRTGNEETQLHKYLKQMTYEQYQYASEFIKAYVKSCGLEKNKSISPIQLNKSSS
ncbi:MAG: helix-turn-helix transcriptional regulator [Clostridia bacterium]|nr:helix-turn-helix transcriptional regulator [Clostridia bacterium]